MVSNSFNVLSLCSGGGGLDLGLKMALDNARVVCYVEREAFAASYLVSAMEEKGLDEAPVWSDIRTFDGAPWSGLVDIITGGYPCQPFSKAGKRGGKKMSVTYGRTLLDSLNKLNQLSSSSKTSPDTSPSDMMKCAMTYDERASMLRAVCLQRRKLVAAICGRDSSSLRWGTPTKRDWKDRKCLYGRVSTFKLLGRESVIFSHQILTKLRNGKPYSNATPNASLQLNPEFSAWLMGWIGANGFPYSATEWSRYKQRMRFALYGLFTKILEA